MTKLRATDRIVFNATAWAAWVVQLAFFCLLGDICHESFEPPARPAFLLRIEGISLLGVWYTPETNVWKGDEITCLAP